MTDPTTPGVCYGRVSTREQAEAGHGLAAQRERAEAYCALTGIAPTEWIADQGRSGSLAPDKRPGLARALGMLAAGQAAALVVPALDRLARSTRDVLDVADRALAQQWRLVVVGLMDSATPKDAPCSPSWPPWPNSNAASSAAAPPKASKPAAARAARQTSQQPQNAPETG